MEWGEFLESIFVSDGGIWIVLKRRVGLSSSRCHLVAQSRPLLTLTRSHFLLLVGLELVVEVVYFISELLEILGEWLGDKFESVGPRIRITSEKSLVLSENSLRVL